MMRFCFRGFGTIAAVAVFGAAAQAQTGTVPLKLTLACSHASDLTFRVTLQNVSTAPVTAAVGAMFGLPKTYLPKRLRFTVSRAGIADSSFEYVDPSLVHVGGWSDPWLVTLPAGASHSMVVSIPSGFRELFSALADVHVSLSTEESRRLGNDAEALRFSHVWFGTLTSDRIAFPGSCQVPSVSVFETETAPGEGRPHFQAVTNELVIRESPLLEATIIRRLSVQAGGGCPDSC